MYENILFEKKDGVAYLTLNRPDRLNALNSAVLKELDDALAAIDGDAEIRVLVVRGAGEKALAAGADITEMQSMEAEAGMAFGAFGQKVFAKIEALRQPVIAMIPALPLAAAVNWPLPATSASHPKRPASASPKSASASRPDSAAPSACPVWWAGARPPCCSSRAT